MSEPTWPDVALMVLAVIFVLAMFIFLAWLAKYWDVFGDNEKQPTANPDRVYPPLLPDALLEAGIDWGSDTLEPTSPIKKGTTVYITISGTGDRKPMRVVNVTNNGEADELELEEV